MLPFTTTDCDANLVYVNLTSANSFLGLGHQKLTASDTYSLCRRMPQPSRYRLYCRHIEVRGCPSASILLLSRTEIHYVKRKAS